jgi:hypothetical protein
VLVAPGGLAGIAVAFTRAMRTNAIGPLLRDWARLAVPTLAALLGAIVLIEIAYRRSTQPEAGALMKLFWISMDTSKPWPWLGAIVLLVAGIAWLRRVSTPSQDGAPSLGPGLRRDDKHA